jgi:hypothetical protein
LIFKGNAGHEKLAGHGAADYAGSQ